MKLKKSILAMALIFLFFSSLANAATNQVYFSRTCLTGGGAACLDNLDGSVLNDGDIAFVTTGNLLYVYKLNAASGAAESSPLVISPDTNAGNKRWILQTPPTASVSDALAASSAYNYLTPSTQREMISNLKPVVNAAVNKLDIFSKSGGAAPDATNPIKVMIPDANGYTQRSRAASYLSGTGQIVMADAANYWSKGSLDAEIKTAWLYAIWDGTGIVWALAGYSGFNVVPTTTTATDDDYFLLEESSTYTRSASHYCVAVAKVRYQYDTADTPDHTLQATGENVPQIIWNPKSDYGYQKNLATTVTGSSDIAEYSAISVVVKQSGKYNIGGQVWGYCSGATTIIFAYIKTGSATYGSATYRAQGKQYGGSGVDQQPTSRAECYLNTGDTIHLGAQVISASGTRTIFGDSSYVGATLLTFDRVD
jgi:hypothetical protein